MAFLRYINEICNTMKMFYAFVGWWMILKKFALHKYNILLIEKSLTEKTKKSIIYF